MKKILTVACVSVFILLVISYFIARQYNGLEIPSFGTAQEQFEFAEKLEKKGDSKTFLAYMKVINRFNKDIKFKVSALLKCAQYSLTASSSDYQKIAAAQIELELAFDKEIRRGNSEFRYIKN